MHTKDHTTLALLRDGSDYLKKVAFQQVCAAAEKGYTIHLDTRYEIASDITNNWPIYSNKTRIWAVKTIGLCRLVAFGPRIHHEVTRNVMLDEEAQSWAVAACALLHDVEAARKVALRSNRFPGSPSLRLAAQFYSSNDERVVPSQRDTLREMDRSALCAKWIAFYFGYNHPASSGLTKHADIDLLAALTTHHDDTVSEHALWGLFRSRHGSAMDARLSLSSVPLLPPNIRRWFYRLACKYKTTFELNLPFLIARIQEETDAYAREGIALGLEFNYSEVLTCYVCDWFISETDTPTKLALLEHLARYAYRSKHYSRAVRDSLALNSRNDVLVEKHIEILSKYRYHTWCRELRSQFAVSLEMGPPQNVMLKDADLRTGPSMAAITNSVVFLGDANVDVRTINIPLLMRDIIELVQNHSISQNRTKNYTTLVEIFSSKKLTAEAKITLAFRLSVIIQSVDRDRESRAIASECTEKPQSRENLLADTAISQILSEYMGDAGGENG